jgi:hypothetical protein
MHLLPSLLNSVVRVLLADGLHGLGGQEVMKMPVSGSSTMIKMQESLSLSASKPSNSFNSIYLI